MWFDIDVQHYSRPVRSTTLAIFLAVTVVVVMIYLFAKMRQTYKQRRNLAVIAPLNIVHHPCFNNLQFNPIIVKSKTFQLHSVSCLICIILFFTLYKLKWVQMHTKYNVVHVFLINFYFSIVIPLNIYWKNPSLKNFLQNDLLGNWFMVMNFLTVFQHWNKILNHAFIISVFITLKNVNWKIKIFIFQLTFLTHFENSFITLSCAYSPIAKIVIYNQHM